MLTFIEDYSKKNYVYTSGSYALVQYILDILNTPLGSRPYYPDYGSNLYRYKFSLMTIENARSLHTEVYSVISSLSNVNISSSDFVLNDINKSVNLTFNIIVNREPVSLNMVYSDGVFR